MIDKMTKVLAIFNHRPEKVANILPYSGLDYMVVSNRKRIKRQGGLPPLVRFAALPISRMINKRDKGYENLIAQYDPDVVFSHGGGPTAPIIRATHKLGKKFVMRLGGHVYEEFKDNMNVPGLNRLLMKPVHGSHYDYLIKNLAESDHIIVVSQDMKHRLVNRYCYPCEKISVVPVPINPARFKTEKTPHKDTVILTIANVNFLPKVRAILDYAPIMMSLIEEYDFTWRVIIPGRYGNMVEKNLALYKSDRVKISGFVEDIYSEYQNADIVAYFSYLDSVPNIVLESWASKTPVIANKCDWTEELTTDGETALLLNSPEELEDAIFSLLDNGRYRENVTENAYQYLLKNHTEEVAGAILGEVMRSI